MTWEQFQEWIAYYSLEPFGEPRADLRAGQIVAAIYNVNRAKASSPILSASDCALQNKRPVRPVHRTPEEQAKFDRIVFDQFKHMVVAVATGGK
jgi:hypothetical protein